MKLIRLSFLICLLACISCQQSYDSFPVRGARDVNPDTQFTLSFTQEPSLGQSGWIRIVDAQSGEVVDSLDMSIPAGPKFGRKYGDECDYTKVPYDYSRTLVATNRNTVPGTPSGTAEPTPPEYQLNIIGGFTDAFHFHPVLIRDNKAIICPHNNMLEYGHRYYLTVDDGVINLPDSSFHGIKAKEWKFTTKSQAPQSADTLIVDCKGKGDFNTVQGALDFIPDFSKRQTVILIREGDYEEIVYARNKTNIKIKGEGMDKVKVHYANNEVFNPHPLLVKTNEVPGTFPSRRAAFMLDNCSDIVLEDLCIATDLFGQAEGLLLNGERIALYRVHIIGSGDALQANGTIYMEECELDGGGDSILGRGSLFAFRSHFRNDGGPVTWVRNTEGNHGDIFVECTFDCRQKNRAIDYGRSHTNHGTDYPYAEVVVIDCQVGQLNPAGWSAIGLKSCQMLEFRTRSIHDGSLVDVSRRHPYSRQLDAVKDAETIEYYRNPANILKGWKPFSYISL